VVVASLRLTGAARRSVHLSRGEAALIVGQLHIDAPWSDLQRGPRWIPVELL